MSVRYDITEVAVTAYCDCGWREIMLTREGAWMVALDHEKRVHPERHGVRDAAEKRAQRAGQCPPSSG